MHEQAEAAHGLVSVEYRSFLLAEPGARDRSASFKPDNGLVFTASPGYTVIVTGISSGDVTVTVEVRQGPPASVDLDGWDEVIDHSMYAPTGNMRVECVDPADEPPDVPLLTPHGPGPYRVRVHARGRDTAPDGVTFDPVEDYRIITWPAPPASDTIHKQTDAVGASWRRTAAPQPSSPRPTDSTSSSPAPKPSPRGSDTEK